MEHDAVPAAAQISQADIIERQAESIARLQRQVKKGGEYKQLTKSKLKEAAARLKEYRLRVEALLQETQALKKQVKEQDKTLKQQQRQAVKAKKHVKNASTQTEAKEVRTRTSQTALSGDVVNRRAMKDSAVQTEKAQVDVLTPKRKRGRDAAAGDAGQLVPKLSRQVELDKTVDAKQTISDVWTPQPLQMNEVVGSAFLHETSAELDAELAFSESEEESGAGETMQIDSGQETASGAVGLKASVGFDSTMLDEVGKELQTSSDEEDEGESAGEKQRGSGSAGQSTVDASKKDAATGHVDKASSLLGRVDAAVFSEIDKDLETSSDEDDGDPSGKQEGGADPTGGDSVLQANVEASGGALKEVGNRQAEAPQKTAAEVRGLDPAISSAIDKDLAFSSDEEEEDEGRRNLGTNTQAKPASQVASTEGGAAVVPQSKPTPMSIDDELDDEFAAMDSDSSSDSSDSDSSDSSDSDSEKNGEDPMTGGADKNEASVAVDGADAQADKNLPESSSLLAVALNRITATQDAARVSLQSTAEKEPALPAAQKQVEGALAIPNESVVVPIPVEEEPLTTSEEVFSPVVEERTQHPAFQPSQLDASAATTCSKSTDQEQVPDAISPSKPAVDPATSENAKPSSSSASASTLPPSKEPEPKKLAEKQTQPSDDDPGSSRNKSDAVPVTTAASSEQAAELSSPTKGSVVGKPRKADEANLDQTPATSQKKVKLAKDGEEAKTPRATAAVKKKAAAPTETKEERRIKNSLAAFKQAIVLGKGEAAGKEYARRTITVLVNQSSKFIDTHLPHVTTLCQVLTEAYRKLDVSPMMVVRGALGVFRTPRSRRLLQENKMGLSWLCNQLLVRLTCSGDQARDQVVPGTWSLSLVDECLLHLRGLLVEDRAHLGDGLSESKLQVAVATQKLNVSHDKVFLAHVCALHTHLCQSTGQVARSRVLLFDMVRANSNIRGLYFAMAMLEVNPAILKREFDAHCVERHWLLKETLQQVLVFISSVAAANEELLLHQSSVTMLHRIAEAIEMPELEEVNGSDPSFSRACVEKLFATFAGACQASSAEPAVQFFEIAKSLELCTAVFGLQLVAEFFSIERCQELFNAANVDAKGGIVSVVGHIAMATQELKTPSEQYVESVLDWLNRIFSTETMDEKAASEDRFKLRLTCATVCVDLILEYSARSGLKTRRRVLCAVVEWFDSLSPDELIDLPATFLRHLRLAVVATRPQVVPRST